MPSPASTNALVLAPLVLAAVLVLSGVAKARDTPSTRSVMVMLRLPRSIATTRVAGILPWAEIALAVLLLVPVLVVARVAAGAALALFTVYWVLVARALTFDPRPTCGCFGRIGDQRVSPRTLVRNTVLVATAGAALGLTASGRTAWDVLSSMDAGAWWWLASAVALAALAVLVLGGGSGAGDPGTSTTGDGTGDVTSAGDGAEDEAYVRRPIPLANLLGLDGTAVTLTELSAAQAQLLVVVNCYCASTGDAVQSVLRWRTELPLIGVQLVTTVDPGRLQERYPDLPADTYVDHGAVTSSVLGLTGSPAAVLLGADGLLAGGPVAGADAVADFVEDIATSLAQAQPRPVSDQASSLSSSSSTQASGAPDVASAPASGSA